MIYEMDSEKGIESLSKLLTGKFGFGKELIRTLVLKYP
jgi:hypothetical protein